MGIKAWLASQFRKPRGMAGRMIGKLMNKANAEMNETVIQLLDIKDQDRVLEMGFGNGYYIAEIAKRVKESIVYGLDYSETMVKLAIKRNQSLIREGRVSIQQGEIEALPYPDAMFNKIFTVNTIYFWSDPQQALRQVYRVLKPGGLFVIGFRDRAMMKKVDPTKHQFSLYTAGEVEEMLTAAGFKDVEVQFCEGNRFFTAVASK